jgi:hypothetical protein
MPRSTVRRPFYGPLVATAALLVSGPAWSGERAKLLPFKAGMSFSEVLGPPTTECYLSAPGGSAAGGTISGSGLATFIGAFSMSSHDCITSSHTPLYPPFNFSSRHVVLQAADGDQLVATYTGTATPQTDGSLVLRGSFTFTGGTGRFATASGYGTLEGVQNIATVPATGFVMLTGQLAR